MDEIIESQYYDRGFKEFTTLPNGEKGTTTAQFLINTVQELCYKAGLSDKETNRYDRAVCKAIKKFPELYSLDTFHKGNWPADLGNW